MSETNAYWHGWLGDLMKLAWMTIQVSIKKRPRSKQIPHISTPPARVTTLWEKIILEKLIFPGMVSLKSEMPQALQDLENPIVIWHSDFHAHGWCLRCLRWCSRRWVEITNRTQQHIDTVGCLMMIFDDVWWLLMGIRRGFETFEILFDIPARFFEPLPLRAVFQSQNLHPTANLLSTGRSSTLWFLWSTPWSVRCWEDPEGFRAPPKWRRGTWSRKFRFHGRLQYLVTPIPVGLSPNSFQFPCWMKLFLAIAHHLWSCWMSKHSQTLYALAMPETIRTTRQVGRLLGHARFDVPAIGSQKMAPHKAIHFLSIGPTHLQLVDRYDRCWSSW